MWVIDELKLECVVKVIELVCCWFVSDDNFYFVRKVECEFVDLVIEY